MDPMRQPFESQGFALMAVAAGAIVAVLIVLLVCLVPPQSTSVLPVPIVRQAQVDAQENREADPARTMLNMMLFLIADRFWCLLAFMAYCICVALGIKAYKDNHLCLADNGHDMKP